VILVKILLKVINSKRILNSWDILIELIKI